MFKLEAQPFKLVRQLKADGHEQEALDLMKCVQKNPLKYFCANGPQELYIQEVVYALDRNPTPIVKLSWGNGIGKTKATLHINCNFIFGPQNGWFDYDVFRNPPLPKTILYDSTAKNLIRNVQPMLLSMIGTSNSVKYVYDENRIEKLLKLKLIEHDDYKEGQHFIARISINGWEWYFNSYDQDAGQLEGSTIGILCLDEPAPQTHWSALKARRRMGCLTLLPMTPLYCPPYIADEIDRAAENKIEGYHKLQASIYEACSRRGVRGHLSSRVVDSMVSQYDKEEIAAKVYGEEMYFSGLIYSNLNRELHFVNPADYPIPLYSHILQIVDPHDSRPSAGMWMAICPNGRKIIFNEYPTEKDRQFWEMKVGRTAEQEVKAWIDIESEYDHFQNKEKYMLFSRILDRHYGWNTKKGGNENKTFADLFREAGEKLGKRFIYLESYQSNTEETEINYGHRRVRQALEPLVDSKPGLVIWNTCYHTWQGLSHYIKANLKGKAADDKASAEGKIVEKYKDFADIVRYGVCADAFAEEPKRKKTEEEKEWEQVINPNYTPEKHYSILGESEAWLNT